MRLITSLILGIACCSSAFAEPDYNGLADAIYKAEGGQLASHSYGIMHKYRQTSPRQACINTARHAWVDYLKTLQRGQKATKRGYLAFLANRYAPNGVANDPKGLNRNWFHNVNELYKGLV